MLSKRAYQVHYWAPGSGRYTRKTLDEDYEKWLERYHRCFHPIPEEDRSCAKTWTVFWCGDKANFPFHEEEPYLDEMLEQYQHNAASFFAWHGSEVEEEAAGWMPRETLERYATVAIDLVRSMCTGQIQHFRALQQSVHHVDVASLLRFFERTLDNSVPRKLNVANYLQLDATIFDALSMCIPENSDTVEHSDAETVLENNTQLFARFSAKAVHIWLYQREFDDLHKFYRLACCYNVVEVVRMLLSDDSPIRVDGIHFGLIAASIIGHHDMMSLLLTDDRVDPTDDRNAAIRHASYYGHIDVVKLLLGRPNVDPAARGNAAIIGASYNGHIDVVKLLLGHGDVEPAAKNKSLRSASYNGHIEIVKLLLGHRDVDPAAMCNIAIRDASFNGHIEIVKLLLEYPKVDPAAMGNDAIGYASARGHVDVVKLLLTCPTVNPADNSTGKDAMRSAIKYGEYPSVVLLLQHPRVRVKIQHLRAAITHGREKILELLLTRPEVWSDIQLDHGEALLQHAQDADPKSLLHMLSTYIDIQLFNI